MIIIGELINASRKAIKAAIEAQDAAAIQKVAEALAGRDNFCMNYLKAFRAGMFE